MGTAVDWPDFNAFPKNTYVDQREALLNAYIGVRSHSKLLTSRFTEAEQQLQSMPDASPTKWHLAHTTWFFETFLLSPFKPGFKWFDDRFRYLFNSYYHAIGSQYPRPKRGLIADPDLERVWVYRTRIDDLVRQLLLDCDDEAFEALAPTLVLGLNHEQQHQELIRTDIKHALFQSAGEPRATKSGATTRSTAKPDWVHVTGGRFEVGYAGEGFCFDNELARHEVLLPPFDISATLVSAGEWLEFMEDGGYDDPLLWLSDGWSWKESNNIGAPGYWRQSINGWCRFTVDGWLNIEGSEPVSNISYYEADAFAAWVCARLPRETEWEVVAISAKGNEMLDRGKCWEWTQSAYSAYPGFRPGEGMAGEYNGKFMVNQMVLRGASHATAAFHSRPSYRNFFYPGARWQFSGLRLARDAD